MDIKTLFNAYTQLRQDPNQLLKKMNIPTEYANDLGIALNSKTKINELPSYETLEELKKRVLKAHTLDMGILVSKDIHYRFHAKYKGKNCNEKNFAKYIKENYCIELSQIRR